MHENIASKFYGENGSFMLLREMLIHVHHRIRNYAISRKLGCSRIRVGRMPRILGLKYMKIGSGFSAGNSLWLEAVSRHAADTYSPFLTIGQNVTMSDSVHIACAFSLSIGNNVLVGSRVIITDHNHGSYTGIAQDNPSTPPNMRKLSCKTTVIEDCVWIGDGVVILPGARIGEGSIIGANSVVSGLIPSSCIALGVPARPVKKFDVETNTWKSLEAKA